MKTLKYEIKEGSGVAIAHSDDGDGKGKIFTISGYASVFGEVDLGGDRTIRGCFSGAKAPIPLLWGHEHKGLPLGAVDLLKEDRVGLLFRARLPADTVRGHEVKRLVQARALQSVSYGYNATKTRNSRVGDKSVRDLLSIDLFEISLVNFGQLPSARLSSWDQKLRPIILDGILIAEVEQAEADHQHVSSDKMARYCDALRRDGERLQYGGKTELKWKSDLAAFNSEMRDALSEVEALQARAKELERSEVVEEHPRRRRKRQLWQLQRDIARIGGDPDSIKR